MAKDQLRDLHVFAMESFLPFGMGVVQNAKSGGLKKIIDVFRSKDPFSEFQIDGETSAKTMRDQIDQLIPGLGYPVVPVDVTVEENFRDSEINDDESLISTLKRIDTHLDELSQYFNNDLNKIDD